MNFGRVASCTLVAWLLCSSARADVAEELKTSRDHLQHGRYAEAIEGYTRIAASAKEQDRVEPVIGLAQALMETGEYEEAEKQLAAAADQLPDEPRLRAHLGALHLFRGRYDDAAKHADAALMKDGEQLLARLVRARVKIEQGQLEPAAEDFRWFVSYYNRRQPKDSEALLAIAEGAAEYARARAVGQVFSFIVNDLTPDALKAQADAWQACLISGSLLLEKYNNGQAQQEFKRGLEINPHSADLLVGKARAELDERNPEEARTSAQQALAINARHIDALLLLADLELGSENPAGALPHIGAALEVNPHLQRALARKAGCDLLINGLPEGEPSLATLKSPAEAPAPIASRDYVAILKLLVEHNPAPGQFLTDLGTVLEQARRYDAATTCYARAIDVAPQLSAPRTALGLLQMRTGDLVSARRILDDAFKADRFHVRVSNMRKVLDVLERYETLSTDHFILRFDAADKVFASYLAEELESLYEPLTTEFGFEPAERTAFEIFSAAKGQSGHSWFSARMTGMPWIQTIGASTGMIVALSSPTSRELYPWARVVKHEFSHVLTLQRTNFNIPHWFTEALAVRTEGDVFPEQWRRSLLNRRDDGKLFTLETVNNGFQRPKNGDDWQHAYCMSRLYARYMEEKHGAESLFKLVTAYQQGLKTPTAIREVFGVPLEEFEKGFVPFLDGVIEEISEGKAPRSLSLGIATARLKEKPDDLDRQADVAWALLNEAPPAKASEAQAMAEKVIEKSPRHPLALSVLARLNLRDRKEGSAKEKLKLAFDPVSPHPAVVSILGRLAFEDKDYETSAKVFSAGLERYPREPSFSFLLAVSLLRLEQTERLPDLFQRVAEYDFDDLISRNWLLEQAVKQENWNDAIRWGRESMQVEVRDPATHRKLGLAYLKVGNRERARRHLQTALDLKAGDEEARKLLEAAR